MSGAIDTKGLDEATATFANHEDPVLVALVNLIQGATHSFTDHLPDIEKLATEWFLKHFKL